MSADRPKEKVNWVWWLRDRWGRKSVAECGKADGGSEKYNLVASIQELKLPRLILVKKKENARFRVQMSIVAVER